MPSKLIPVFVDSNECAICKRTMVYARRVINHENHCGDYHLFPRFWGNNLESQLKKQGVVIQGKMLHGEDNDPICEECENAGKVMFTCYLCNKLLPSKMCHKSFGEACRAHHLCEECYSTTPAKQWEKTVEELETEHRWDFE